jgi:hypothetical protein
VKQNHFRLFAILIGLLVCGGACYGILQLRNVPAEGHWTPAAYAPPLAQVSDRVEVFVAGEPILKLVEAQALVLKQKDSEAPVTADKLTATTNNYDRARLATRRPMLALAAAAGGGFVLFLIGLFTPLINALKPPLIVDLHLEE